MINLEDSQIWESDSCVIQIQSMGKNHFDFRGIIFQKDKNGILKFNNVIYNEKNRLVELVTTLNMKLGTKKIITKEI